jgi:hypothetical protein
MKLLISLLIVMVAASAAGEEKRRKVEYRKTQELSFDAQDVDGEHRTPDGAFVNPQKGVRFMPIYKVDKRFDEAIKESPEFVR